MVERFRLSLPAGQAETCQVAWEDPRFNGTPGGTGLGTMQWTVVVLPPAGVNAEAEVDLAVTACLGLQAHEEASSKLPLQKMSRGRTFSGTFDPAKDRRLVGPIRDGQQGSNVGEARKGGPAVDSLLFEFSNAFSWWTGREVELVIVREREPGAPLSQVPPLPPLEPQLPRNPQSSDTDTLGAVPELRVALPQQQSNPHKLRDYAAQLDNWLASAEAQAPQQDGSDNTWLLDLLAHVAAIRGQCKEAPDDPPVPVLQAGAKKPTQGPHANDAAKCPVAPFTMPPVAASAAEKAADKPAVNRTVGAVPAVAVKQVAGRQWPPKP